MKKVKRSTSSTDFFSIDFLLAVPQDWAQERKEAAENFLSEWQSNSLVKCCMEANEVNAENQLSKHLYGFGRILKYKGRQNGDPHTHIQFVYEGQFQEDFKGFGRFIFYYQKRLVVGWWDKYKILNGQGIYYERGAIKHQGLFSKQLYFESPKVEHTIRDFTSQFGA